MFRCTGIRPVRFIVLEKRGELLRYHDPLRFIFSSASRPEHSPPGRKAVVAVRMWILSDFSLISSCLTARSAFPYETEKAAALPVAKHHRLCPRTYIYWVATAIGVVRPLAGLGSMDIKNALSRYSGVFHRPRSKPLYDV